MAKDKTLEEAGKFKKEISTALLKNKDIVEMLIGDTAGLSGSALRSAFLNYVKSHLFIDDTLTEAGTYIFYDVIFPSLQTHTKSCYVLMYLICAREVLDDYHKEGYYGNRIDILSQMVEDTLINDDDVSRSFGIGELQLDSVDVYNAMRFYGRILRFSVPSFR